MKTGKAGKELIKSFEVEPGTGKPHLEAYLCPSGQWTIGYGNTYYEDKSPVKEGDFITEARADELFENMIKVYEKQVKHLVKIDLHQHEFDALVSFFWNAVYSALVGSNTLKVLNDGDKEGFLKWHAKWIKDSKGNDLEGLIRRREAEAKLFRGKV